MKKLLFLSMVLSSLFAAAFCTSCSDDEDSGNRDHDGTLLGEWVEVNDGKMYVHGYYYFDSDGTGISGSYESDIDWINEDDDIKWYTVDDEYLYIDGARYEYWCDGSSLEMVSSSGKTREYRAL